MRNIPRKTWQVSQTVFPRAFPPPTFRVRMRVYGKTGETTLYITETLQVNCKPVHCQVLRIGKHGKYKNRLVLVKMKSFRERVAMAKAAKNLRGSAVFIMEDLSKSERNSRKVLVEKLKIARSYGRKADTQMKN